MLIKHYNTSGIVTWSNSKTNSHLLAHSPLTSTQEGPFNLDILALDLTEKSKELGVLGRAVSSTPFRCLAWDVFGEKNGIYPSGLIFGGMEDGGITLWDPSQIIANKRNVAAPDTVGLVYKEEPIYDFPIICAEWNALQPNLLGLGTTEVLAMDIGEGLSNDPNIFKISQKNPHAGSYITAVAWNKQVAHIMASASDNGLIALWDVKMNKPIFSFNDNNNGNSQKNISIAWSKSVFAQIAVTLDDENKNQLQIWDLRNQKGPIVVIDKNHSKGINCMDWSDNDPELILASSKDNKVICWNYVREQPVSEMQLSEAVVDIKWSKKLPSIYYVSTESKLQIYTMDDNNLYSYVPKWYKVPVGTTVGPNNSILSFDDKQSTTLIEQTYHLSNEKLQPSISNLQNFLKTQNIEAYLKARKNNASSQEKQFWGLMELMSSGGVQTDIYNFLGFNRDDIVKSAEQYTKKKYDSHTQSNKVVKTHDYINYSKQDASDFFAEMMNQNEGNSRIEQPLENENIKYEMVPRNHNWDIGKEKIIKQNLLIGNYTGAIDAALKSGRGAEALVIAYSQGQEIFKATLKTFFTETTDPFITGTLRYIADRELEDMVKRYPLQQWKECVAFIYSLVRDHRAEHLNALAQRLLQDVNERNNALICLALAEDFNELLSVFDKSISKMESGAVRKVELLNLVQKLLVIARITTKQVGRSALFDRFILETALILIEEGHSALAGQVLELGNVNDQKIAQMRYIIAQSHPNTKNTVHNPFKGVNIPIMQKKAKKGQNPQAQKGPVSQQNPSQGSANPNSNVQRPQPKGIVRPNQPIFPPKQEEQTNFNPIVPNQNATTGFNPNTPVSNANTTKPNVIPPPSNIKKPVNPPSRMPPAKNVEVPVNIPPKRQEYQNTFTANEPSSQSSFNPNLNNFNPNQGYGQQTQSSHLNIPASSIPSINVRNKPPPPPPKAVIKKVESVPEERVEESQHNASFQSNKQPQYQHPPPPPTNKTTPPPPPPASNTYYQNKEQPPTQHNIPPASQQNSQYNQYQNQAYGYQPQPVVQVQQPPVQIQAPPSNPPPAARRPVPPPPRKNN